MVRYFDKIISLEPDTKGENNSITMGDHNRSKSWTLIFMPARPCCVCMSYSIHVYFSTIQISRSSYDFWYDSGNKLWGRVGLWQREEE